MEHVCDGIPISYSILNDIDEVCSMFFFFKTPVCVLHHPIHLQEVLSKQRPAGTQVTRSGTSRWQSEHAPFYRLSR